MSLCASWSEERVRGGSILSGFFLTLAWRVPYNHSVSGSLILVISSLKTSLPMELLGRIEHSNLLQLSLGLQFPPPIINNTVPGTARPTSSSGGFVVEK